MSSSSNSNPSNHHQQQQPKYFIPGSGIETHIGSVFISQQDLSLTQPSTHYSYKKLYHQERRYYSTKNSDSDDELHLSHKPVSSQPQSLSHIGSSSRHNRDSEEDVSSELGVVDDPLLVRSELAKSFVKEITEVRGYLRSFRKWEYTQLGKLIGNSKDQRSIGDGTRFFVMNYNILSQHLMSMHGELYKACDPRALNHSFRKQLFFSELDEIQPDVLCLQEVEESDYYKVHEPTLFLKGYKGVYKKRTGDKHDGCAIFYKATRFGYVDKLSVEYFQPHIPLLNRDNIGLFIKLRSNKLGPGKKQTFIVGTTHILFNPNRQDVKLAQLQVLLAELDRFAFCGLDSKGQEKYHPIILTGDFNCEPHNQLVRFLSDGIFRTDPPVSNPFSHREKCISSFIPDHAGISDQCQHYKLVLERMKHRQKSRQDNFELDGKLQPSLINLYASESYPTDLEAATTLDDVDSDEFIRRSNTTTPLPERSTNKINSRSVTFKFDPDPDNVTSDPSGMFEAFAKGASGSKTTTPAPSIQTELDPETHAKVIEEISSQGHSCSFQSRQLSHNFRLSNVYTPRLDRPGNPAFGCTTKQGCWTTVDYIFYSKIWNDQYNKLTEGKLRLIRRLGLLDREQCKQFGPIPNLGVSSDHYSLVAEFVLK